MLLNIIPIGMCDVMDGQVYCEGVAAQLPWEICPIGEVRTAAAWFGREAGDKTTCAAGKTVAELGTVWGSDVSAKVTKW